ncbi:MAG TPA: S8 family serine peptidase [Pyrinomonadaceae bacterium]|nr:S8 family serine peptidase [Pyrinomonadaceae bacterium]
MLRIAQFPPSILKKAKQFVAITLICLFGFSPVIAGISLIASNGIVISGADGIVISGADGIVISGADSILNQGTDGIVINGADGLPTTGNDGIVISGADGYAYPNSVQATTADGLTVARSEGMILFGANGIVINGADGTTYQADSVTITIPNGIVINGADGIVINGADGVERVGSDGIVINGADGIVAESPDGIVINGADSVIGLAPSGTFPINPNGLTFSGVTGIVINGADDIGLTGATGIVISGADGLVSGGEGQSVGIQSVDPELAATLNNLADDSGLNAVVIYHQSPTESDLSNLRSVGILGGLRFRTLPAILITATRDQILAISRFPAVRSIYGNRTLNFNSEPEVRALTGVDRARLDLELTANNANLPVTGRNVTVAVLDSGIDGNHRDLADRVIKNVKLVDTQSISVGFNYPANIENLANTDLVLGHGTFVAGLIAGNGKASGGKYAGVAPDAKLVGLSAGDVTLLSVLNGLDYLLTNGPALGVKVVNCSFSANTVFDSNDPVNIATKMLTDAGVNVVFSAGNTGPGANSLNPYSVAPWVISVGATDRQAKLASFSSRGNFGSALFRPTLVAPGVNVVSTRGLGVVNVTGALGLLNADLLSLSLAEIPYYTTSSGTSFSAPQAAGAIALMLEANPGLTPAEVRDILQRTATPLPPYYLHEAGTGMLNVHAAVLEAAFPTRRIGSWRGTYDRGQVEFLNDPLVQFSGTVQPWGSVQKTITIPEGTLTASIQVGWGPLWSTNDLSLSVYDPSGKLRAQSNIANLPGLGGKRERVVLKSPTPGSWRVVVKHTFGLAVTSQPFVGVLEVSRAQYDVLDLSTMTSVVREDVLQNIRSYTMYPIGNKFRADFAVSRSDFAMSLVLGARVPQYLPGQPTFPDVNGDKTRLFVESVHASPNGPIFADVSPGGNFRPNDNITRLMATVALVRAAGLRAEAESKSGALLPYLDAASIPSQYKGYVAVAVSKGLVQTDLWFRPQAAFTRAELAHGMTVIQTGATQ